MARSMLQYTPNTHLLYEQDGEFELVRKCALLYLISCKVLLVFVAMFKFSSVAEISNLLALWFQYLELLNLMSRALVTIPSHFILVGLV